MTETKVQCPHCQEIFGVDLPEAKPGDLPPVTRKELAEILKRPALDLDHRHKTADEFLDCPECRLWIDKTAQRYQVVAKEPAAPPAEEKPADQPGEEKPGEKKPAAARSAIGSIFSAKRGGEHERQG